MPEWADLITDQMLELSARPVRLNINGYNKDYEDVKDVFAALLETLIGISSFTKDLIESADMSGDDEVRIFGEEFLMAAATIGAIFIGEYSEAVAVMILFQLGEFLEANNIDILVNNGSSEFKNPSKISFAFSK